MCQLQVGRWPEEECVHSTPSWAGWRARHRPERVDTCSSSEVQFYRCLDVYWGARRHTCTVLRCTARGRRFAVHLCCELTAVAIAPGTAEELMRV
jgi:hypothetical protein